MIDIDEKIRQVRSEPLRADGIRILQLNLGYKCNMACKHCHVEAGPGRTERMDREIIDAALGVSGDHGINTLDLTGGAPELNSSFRYLVREAKNNGRHVIVRTNLTIFFEEGMSDLPEFYADHDVEVVASLPHYNEGNTDRVRGRGTFSKSVGAIKRLNSLGYGSSEIKRLNLVYNPFGAFLPACQSVLEDHYRKELLFTFGIVFNRLYVFANMPVGRFRDFLLRSHRFDQYMEKVRSAFNPDTVNNLMCRYLLSVGWNGKLYDCDFNQVLGLTVGDGCSPDIRNFDYSMLSARKIVTGDHCFVCMAGQGST